MPTRTCVEMLKPQMWDLVNMNLQNDSDIAEDLILEQCHSVTNSDFFFTVWKFKNFSVTHILREINFCGIGFDYYIHRLWSWDFLENCTLFRVMVSRKIWVTEKYLIFHTVINYKIVKRDKASSICFANLFFSSLSTM